MAAANLLALLDDITSMLDDVALMTKVAAKKTVGVLADDLALNAQQVSGGSANRELPVIIKVATGSLLNKAILIPLALLISAFIPWLITPLLMVGGAYLSFEGAEKVFERLTHKKAKPHASVSEKTAARPPAQVEKQKIKGAIRTDFILSTEIIVIALGSIPESLPFFERAVVLSLVGVLITVGVYGVVAAIVKIDDAGLWMMRKSGGKGFWTTVGSALVNSMPYLMRFLTIAGTIAMFMVGGGILAHGIPWLDVRIESLSGLFLPGIKAALLHIGVGLIAGMVILLIVNLTKRVFARHASLHG